MADARIRAALRLARLVGAGAEAVEAEADLAREQLTSALPVPRAQWYRGKHAEFIMPPFLAPSPSRFSDGRYGVLYSAFALETAATEHGYHLQFFLQSARAPRGFFRRQHITLQAKRPVPDLRRDDPALFDPNDYRIAQERGSCVRADGAPALVYPSVRHRGGTCVAFFIPSSIGQVRLLDTIAYAWDGGQLAVFQAMR